MSKVSLIIVISALIQMLFISGIKTENPATEEQLQRLRTGLRKALETDDSPINRYYAFENLINVFEQNCKRIAFQTYIDGSNVSNAGVIKSEINEFYDEHVRYYPEQSKQAILDQQIPGPIVTNSAIAARALCNQMLTLSRDKVRAAQGK